MNQGSTEAATAESKVRLIYIVGLSHSGSTLLDLLLNAHSNLASVGELKKFGPRILDPEKICTCGKRPLDGCSFWPEVVSRLEACGRRAGDFSTDRGDLAANVDLLKAIHDASGGSIVVDSSKLTRRLELLLASPELDILPVFLVRDVRGQICSTLRKRPGLLAAIRDHNQISRKILTTLRGRHHLLVRYEELVADPRRAIEPILVHFGQHFEASQLDWASAPKHSLGGNRMRHRRESVIRRDDRWRRELSLLQRSVIGLATARTRARLAAHGRRGVTPSGMLRALGAAILPRKLAT